MANFLKGLNEGLTTGAAIGSAAAQKRLDQVVKQKEKLQKLEDEEKNIDAIANAAAQNVKTIGGTAQQAKDLDEQIRNTTDTSSAATIARTGFDAINKSKEKTPSTFEQGKEERRVGQFEFAKKQEDRRLRQEKAIRLDSFGLDIPEDEADEFQNELGIPIDDMVESGLGTRVKGKDGKPDRIKVFNKTKRDKITTTKFLTSQEVDTLDTRADARDKMREVLDSLTGLNTQGLDQEKLFKEVAEAIPEGFFEQSGPFSLQARFRDIAQLKDPKYASLADKLDRVFQAYRKIITGAQASDKELRILRPLIANFLQTPERFVLNATDLITEVDNSLTRRLGLMEDQGRDVSKVRKRLGLDTEVAESASSGGLTTPSGISFKIIKG